MLADLVVIAFGGLVALAALLGISRYQGEGYPVPSTTAVGIGTVLLVTGLLIAIVGSVAANVRRHRRRRRYWTTALVAYCAGLLVLLVG